MTDKQDKPIEDKCPECGYALAVHGQPKLHLPCQLNKASIKETTNS